MNMNFTVKKFVSVNTIMPKRRRCSSSLGRKTKVARKYQERRRREIQELKERSIHQVRVFTSSARQQECPESRGKKFQQNLEVTTTARQQESPARQTESVQDRRQTASRQEQQRRQLGPKYNKARTGESILSDGQWVAYSYVGPLIDAEGTAMYMLQTI